MEKNLNNILLINTGGGIGDALCYLPTLNYINENLKPKKLYYFSTDLGNFWFDTKLKEYRPNNLISVKSFPEHFGFRNHHSKISRDVIKNFEFDKFDLIIDNQTRLKNTLIYKKIPHEYYVSPCLNYLMSKPVTFMKKREIFAERIISYFNKLKKLNIKPNYNIKIPDNFLMEARKLIPNKNYVGFSITAGHPTRVKEINLNEIVKVASYFSDKFIPTFFIENKYQNVISEIEKNVEKAYFPENQARDEFKKPMLVTALGSLTKFNITIDNGISHMLSFSNNKNYIFFNNSSKKFQPMNNNSVIYDCSLYNSSIDKLSSEEIIKFIEEN